MSNIKHLFKLSCLLFLIVGSIYGQKKKVYSKSFEVNNKTIATFNLKNIPITIEESIDDKIHFEYNIEFRGYSTKEVEDFLRSLKIDVDSFNNHVNLQASSEKKISSFSFELMSKYGIAVDYDSFVTKKSDLAEKKSKETIVEQINKGFNKSIEDAFKMFKKIGEGGKKSSITSKDIKLKNSNFIIRIPSYIQLILNAENSQIVFGSKFKNKLKMVLKSCLLRAREMNNSENNIKIEAGDFKIEKIVEGDYVLNNVNKVLLGSVSGAKITSEFSKIEIGEIGKNVDITDFNGKLWFYEFSSNFKKFNLKSEYSKIHLFCPKTDFSLTAMGKNAINIKTHFSNKEVVGGTSTSDSFYKIMTRKAKGVGHFSGDIHLEIDNGIIDVYKNNRD